MKPVARNRDEGEVRPPHRAPRKGSGRSGVVLVVILLAAVVGSMRVLDATAQGLAAVVVFASILYLWVDNHRSAIRALDERVRRLEQERTGSQPDASQDGESAGAPAAPVTRSL